MRLRCGPSITGPTQGMTIARFAGRSEFVAMSSTDAWGPGMTTVVIATLSF